MKATVLQGLGKCCCSIAIIFTSVAGATAQSISLPGTIQVEDFDQGDAGVAYYDLSAGNSGGEYRATDVDIEACDEGGFNVGWVNPGEWLRYTVNPSQSGSYTLEFRVAAVGAGGTFHIEVNGVDRTGPISIPDTGGWQNWTTVTRSGVNLSAGSQTWRVVVDAVGGSGNVGNFNYIRATAPLVATAASIPYGSTPTSLPGIVQAENFDNGGEGIAYHDSSIENEGGQYRSTGVDIEPTTDGGGYSVGWTFAGEWLAYSVNVASAGTYDIEVRVASNGQGGTFHIEVNGADKTGPLTVPDTGGWQNWTTTRRTGVSLSAGQQVLTLVMDAGGSSGAVANFNYIRVVAGTGGGGGGSTPYTGTAVVLPGTVQFEAFDNGGEGVAYHDLSAENSGGAFRTTGVDIEPTSDSGGGHNVAHVFASEWLAYTVNVATAGTYDLEARVASNGIGGSFHVEINGIDRTGPFSVPNTGGSQTWVTIRKTGLSLSAGQQVWRVVFDSNSSTTATTQWTLCAVEGAFCAFTGTREVRYGANGIYYSRSLTDGAACTNAVFGDPLPGVIKRCDVGSTAATAPAATTQWTSCAVEGAFCAFTGTREVRYGANGIYYSRSLTDGAACTNAVFGDPLPGVIKRCDLGPASGTSTTAVGNLNYFRVVAGSGSSNQPPSVNVTTPANGAMYTAPANMTITAAASDSNGSVSRVDFYAGSTLIGSDASSPYSINWAAAAGTYSLTAVAYDDAGASTRSGAVSVTVSSVVSTPTAVVFNASPDHASLVSSYSVALYRHEDPVTVSPVATKSLGKPDPTNGEISASISDIVNPLPSGSYYAVVAAVGSGGSAASAPSAPFSK